MKINLLYLGYCFGFIMLFSNLSFGDRQNKYEREEIDRSEKNGDDHHFKYNNYAFCNKIGDDIVGQYFGSHPDGSNPSAGSISAAGTGILNDTSGLGGGAEWWTAASGSPIGNPTFGTLTWEKDKYHKYDIKFAGLVGTPTDLSTDSNGDPLTGGFPVKDFYRITAGCHAQLSSDCKSLDIYITQVCTYQIPAINAVDINPLAQGTCSQLDDSVPFIQLFKIPDAGYPDNS